MRIVVKIGTSSITDASGSLTEAPMAKLCSEIAALRAEHHQVVLVTSGAISAGVPALALAERPRDPVTLQAISAVGQIHLMAIYDRLLAAHGLVSGQLLLSPMDFFERSQYLHARGCIERLLELGVVPVINENDAVADDAIRFGDNDRIAAHVAHLVTADVLVLLTDAPGLLTADPREDESASLIEEIEEVDHSLELLAGGAGTVRGSGGMATKLGAAKIAAWSGVRTVIGAASRPDVVGDAVAGAPGVGTVVRPRNTRLSARRLWIAFALPADGILTVDEGARRALVERGRSLLPVGVTAVKGTFVAGDAVEIAGPDGVVFAKGLTRADATQLQRMHGRRTENLPESDPDEVVHRDELVLLP
jgi:glutamate 5-kinase